MSSLCKGHKVAAFTLPLQRPFSSSSSCQPRLPSFVCAAACITVGATYDTQKWKKVCVCAEEGRRRERQAERGRGKRRRGKEKRMKRRGKRQRSIGQQQERRKGHTVQMRGKECG